MIPLILVGVLVYVVVVVRSWVHHRAFAVELANRPRLQFTVAGLDKDREVGRHTFFSTFPWRRRRIRRMLDEAAVKIAAQEAEERRRSRGRD